MNEERTGSAYDKWIIAVVICDIYFLWRSTKCKFTIHIVSNIFRSDV